MITLICSKTQITGERKELHLNGRQVQGKDSDKQRLKGDSSSVLHPSWNVSPSSNHFRRVGYLLLTI